MSRKLNLGDNILPLRNVALLSGLIKRVEQRRWGLPGMAVFHGKTGHGKTYACSGAVVGMDVIHISVQQLWNKKKLMTSILRELQMPQTGTLADLMERCNEGLAIADRTLIIDEADYAVDRGMIEMIRDMHDGSGASIILVGMEQLPQKLKKWELVDGRILAWVGAEPADFQDAKLMANWYAKGITLDDALIEKVRTENNGSARRMSVDFAHVLDCAHQSGQTTMTLDAWGDAPFLRGEAPVAREGL